MTDDTRLILLRWTLRLVAVFQALFWGATHLFFPAWYLRLIGADGARAADPLVLLFMNEIGILVLGLAIATWIAASDPLRHVALIGVLYAVGVGSMAASLWHVLVKGFAFGEWTTIVAIGAQLGIVTGLYPWPRLKCQEPSIPAR
jgi:hypothetical protein